MQGSQWQLVTDCMKSMRGWARWLFDEPGPHRVTLIPLPMNCWDTCGARGVPASLFAAGLLQKGWAQSPTTVAK